MAAQPPDEVLPCGCIFRYAVVDGINTMTVIPCRKTCDVLSAVIAEASEQGKPIEYRGGR